MPIRIITRTYIVQQIDNEGNLIKEYPPTPMPLDTYETLSGMPVTEQTIVQQFVAPRPAFSAKPSTTGRKAAKRSALAEKLGISNQQLRVLPSTQERDQEVLECLSKGMLEADMEKRFDISKATLLHLIKEAKKRNELRERLREFDPVPRAEGETKIPVRLVDGMPLLTDEEVEALGLEDEDPGQSTTIQNPNDTI